mgnify:CR=1 FL=1
MSYSSVKLNLRVETDRLSDYINQYIICSIPKDKRYLRDEMQKELYDLMKNLYFAYFNQNNIRRKHITSCKVNIGMIDYLLGKIFYSKWCNQKRFSEATKRLEVIRNLVYGWATNEEKSKAKAN